MRNRQQATLRRLGLGFIALAAVFTVAVSVTDATFGPGSAPGVGSGAISSDAQNNVSVGNSTPNAATKLSVTGSSTATTAYTLQAFQPGGASIFYVRNDGAVSIPGSLTVGTFTATMAATNVSSGAFGANTGGGNYTFPARLSVGTTSTAYPFQAASTDADLNTAFLLSFPGIGSGGYKNGLEIRSTHPDSYFAAHIKLSNGSLYNTNGIIQTANNNGLYFTSTANNVKHVFSSVSYNFATFSDSAANPTLDLTTLFANKVGLSVKAVASQTANLQEWRNSSDSPMSVVTANGSLGIGTSTPAYSLSVAGTVYSATGGFRFPDGTTQTTAAAGGSTTTPATNVSAGAFGANTGGGNYSFPGSVGIGATSPTSALHVNGTAGFNWAAGAPESSFAGTFTLGTMGTGGSFALRTPSLNSSFASGLGIDGSYASQNSVINLKAAGVRSGGGYTSAMAFYTSSDTTLSEQMRLTGAGNLGVGTTSPAYKLSVAGTVYSSTGGFRFPDGTTQTTAAGGSTIAAPNVSAGSFGANTGGGNYGFPASLGVGTASPATTLQVGSTSYTNNSLITIASGNGSSLRTYSLGVPYGAGVVSGRFYDFVIRDESASADRLNIDWSTGYVGIANSAPGYHLDVAGDVNMTGALRFGGSAGTSGYVLRSNGASAPSWVATSTLGFSGGASTMAATNISSGAFGANTGGGNYSFPAQLTVSGKLTISTAAAATGFDMATADSYAEMRVIRNSVNSADKDLYLQYQAGAVSKIHFYSNNSESMTLAGTNLGIGNAGPSYKLDVTGDVNITGALRASGSAGTSGYVLQTTGSGIQWVATSSLGISGGGGGTVTAANVSSGAFGANTGGGNYSFPGTLGASGIITSSGGSANIGAHPSYGGSYSGFWRTGVDYSLLTEGTNTFLNAPSSGGALYFRTGNLDRMVLSGTTLTIGGGTGKINVGTVDPIYVINGEKFATYMAGMIGVKEEVAGMLVIPCKGGTCERAIDFANEPKGSDFWLFGKTTDIRKHLSQASVMLTPAFDGRVSYRKEDGILTVIAKPFAQADEVEVSYRFTAPRFDADQWGNRTNDAANGFIIND